MKLLQNVNCEVQAPSGTPSLQDEKAPKRVKGSYTIWGFIV